MIELPPERVGPYVRALAAAIRALAPGEEHVPMSRALGHLGALDPVHGGDLLLPAEVWPSTGMPGYGWLERARSESELAKASDGRSPPTDEDLGRIHRLDPALAARMRDRRELHRYLATAELLATTRLGGAVRWFGPTESTVGLAYDRIAPDGRWVRIRFELAVRAGTADALRVDRTGRLAVDDSVRHLLTRHFAVPLAALRMQIEDATGSRVARLSRGVLGPFWFPGIALPSGLPAALGEGLLLHASIELADPSLREPRNLDPLATGDEDAAPDPAKWPAFRERRFAAGGRAIEALDRWSEALGIRLPVVTIEVGAKRRQL